MAHIEISRSHELTAKKAKAAAEQAGKRLSKEFGLNYRWEAAALHFERSGVKGYLHLGTDSVRIVVSLGLMLTPFKRRIEEEIQRNLDEFFTGRKNEHRQDDPG
jgi:putative polyhydroxyalkanoate system protein